jgi:hypothetical protein
MPVCQVSHGGLVGVDVLFVISGCVITSGLPAAINAERFSIINFYVRRLRRILPALLATVMATTIGDLGALACLARTSTRRAATVPTELQCRTVPSSRLAKAYEELRAYSGSNGDYLCSAADEQHQLGEVPGVCTTVVANTADVEY